MSSVCCSLKVNEMNTLLSLFSNVAYQPVSCGMVHNRIDKRVVIVMKMDLWMSTWSLYSEMLCNASGGPGVL